MLYFSFALVTIAGLAAAVYLGINNHPWLAIACLLTIGGISYTNSKGKENDDNEGD